MCLTLYTAGQRVLHSLNRAVKAMLRMSCPILTLAQRMQARLNNRVCSGLQTLMKMNAVQILSYLIHFR